MVAKGESKKSNFKNKFFLIVIFLVISVTVLFIYLHNNENEINKDKVNLDKDIFGPDVDGTPRGSEDPNITDEEFKTKYGVTKLEFNECWFNDECWEIKINENYSVGEIEYPQNLLLNLSYEGLEYYLNAIGKDRNEYYNNLVSKTLIRDQNIPKFSNNNYDLYEFQRIDEYKKVNGKTIKTYSDNKNIIFAIFCDYECSVNIDSLKNELGKPQYSFVDEIRPEYEIYFYFDKGVAFINNKLLLFEPTVDVDEELLKYIGLKERSDGGNPNSYFVEYE